MKILIIHNSYQQLGGEDMVVRNEVDLLRTNGNEVLVHVISNMTIRGVFNKFKAALGVVFSLPAYFRVRQILRDAAPDVVHVHNFFPLLSPSVFYACHSLKIPVIMTLHNYRIICPTALLMHDSVVTERSLRDGPWWAVKHRVYRGSLVGTFLLCLMISTHRRLRTWRTKVDRYIVLSQFARTRFAAAGIPIDALMVKPNFVDLAAPIGSARSGLLFVGRLSPEKGIDTLLAATDQLAAESKLNPGTTIAVAGSGFLGEIVAANVNLLHLGALPSEAVRLRMQSAVALLIPSIWYEGFPMVLVEAYANGLPVIASRIGALAELVEDGVTGLLFKPGDVGDLAGKMSWALEHPGEMHRMGQAARERYELLYTPARNYEQLMAIYREAIRSNRMR